MELNQVIKLKLKTTDEQLVLFKDVTEQYRKACNYVSEYIFDNDFELNSFKLSKLLYHEIREEFRLKSQLAQSVFRTVTARYKTTQTQLQQKPFKYQDESGKWCRIYKDLNWLTKPVYFKRPQADLIRNRDYSFIEGGSVLSINTLESRVRTTFNTKGFDHYMDGSWSFGTAKLVQLKKNWFLHISVSKTVPDFNKENLNHVVGIDRGLNFLTVSYDEKGKTYFTDGRKIMKKRENYNKVRAELQSKGTKSAKRRLKKLAQRENRWMTDVNHRLSKTLVNQYVEGTVFVLEDLVDVTFSVEHLSKKQRNKHRSWSFYQFEQFLDYKSRNNQSETVKVSAAYTSQRCPKCGTIDKSSRNHKTHEYHCKNCKYRSNDDRIAAMNIQLLGTQWISGNEKPKFEKIITD